jgi:hypothetical protein
MKLNLIAAALGLAFALPVLADTTIVQQFGDNNYANVDQSNSVGATVHVTQVGDHNNVGNPVDGVAGVTQTNIVGFAFANVAQQGDHNQAWISQNDGTNQTATIQQGGGGLGGDASNNYAAWNQGGNTQTLTIVQGGSNNTAWGSQGGSNNVATINQRGSWNFAGALHQDGSGGAPNVMSITQSGDSSSAWSNVAWTLNQSGSGNSMDIEQSGGFNNTAQFLSQAGNNNVVTIAQNGTGNLVQFSSQVGSNNSVNVSQTGNFHGAGYSQFGNSNSTVITQH